jgi:hypothetical protein
MIASSAFYISRKYEHNYLLKNRALEHKVKEIDTLILLNKKISELLQKRSLLMPDFVSFDVFDDVHISFDDYAYLESFAAQNNFYLPAYIMEVFFENIAHRRVVLSPEETVQIGGYTFRDGRIELDKLSDELLNMIEEKKREIKKVTDEPIFLLKSNRYY